jgi:hypothetical protein
MTSGKNPIPEVTSEQAGVAWAMDAVRDALTKDKPEDCRFVLDSLKVMALQLLANEAFNIGLGLGGGQKEKPTELVWSKKRYSSALVQINHQLEHRVNILVKMQKNGELTLLHSVQKEEPKVRGNDEIYSEFRDNALKHPIEHDNVVHI